VLTRRRLLSSALLLSAGASFAPLAPAGAQGCMPLRLSAPTYSGVRSSYLESGQWQFGLAARRVAADQFFVSDHADASAGPGGHPVSLRLHSASLSGSYGISDRWGITLSVPFSYSSENRMNPDGQFHKATASGIGDLSLLATAWVLNPPANVNGNVSFGAGIKLPTGSYHREAQTYFPDKVVTGPATQTIQPGDGGAAILTQVQAFQAVFPRGWIYAAADYAMSLRKHTDVFWAPVGKVWAVPDVFSARAGAGYAALPRFGIALNAGGRIDGTASRNLLTGRDDSYRKTGYTIFFEPGISWVRAHHIVNLSVPIRLRHKYLDVMTDDGPVPGFGGVPKYVVYASYAWRW
jgi:hypothetical protein